MAAISIATPAARGCKYFKTRHNHFRIKGGKFTWGF